jgi:hypothetical protein
MDKKQVLEKAIQKALDNGWLDSHKMKSFKNWVIDFDCYGEEHAWAEIQQDYLKSRWQLPKTVYKWDTDEQLLYDKSFAKALWGVNPMWSNDPMGAYNDSPKETNWQHHLQLMVIADDPIKYLGDNYATR